MLEVRKGKGKGKEKEKEKQTAVKEGGVKKGKVKVSYMRGREGSFIEIIIFVRLKILNLRLKLRLILPVHKKLKVFKLANY